MWSFLSIALFGLLCIIIQTNPIINRYLFLVKPDFTIPLVLYISLSQTQARGCVLVVWIGFLMDLFSGGVMGLFLFLRTLLYFFILLIRKIFFVENKPMWVLLVLVFFLWDSFCLHLFSGLMGRGFGGAGGGLRVTLARAAFTLFLSLLIFPPFHKLEKAIKKRWKE